MTTAPKPLRADAERNRRRILDAARQALAAQGAEASMDDIARIAEVGVGTIYRRFPTKEELVTEVVRDRLVAVIERIDAEGAAPDPWVAFSGVMQALAQLVACDRALYELLMVRSSVRDAVAGERRRMRARLRPVLERAQAAGHVRGDVVVEDLLVLATLAARLPAWRVERQPKLWRRYLALALDGLRAEGASELPYAPPR
jgi:AcrR family transcriptional regulator